jgi:hypothetical protein
LGNVLNPYYCHQCKKLLKTLEELLFVEEPQSYGFCSEGCIESFYTPLVDYFDAEEERVRRKLNLQEEDILEIVGHPLYLDETLRRPQEVWINENDVESKITVFISEYDDPKWGKFFLLVLCYTFEQKPSFILGTTVTRQKLVLDHYREGAKEDPSFYNQEGPRKTHIEIDESKMNDVERKKSQYLAHLLEERSPADIPFEFFHLYEPYFETTIMEADETYIHKDDEGDEILTYIKAHEKDGVSFYYFIINLKYSTNVKDETDSLIPILSFPTVDGDIYRAYRKGEQVSGGLKM